MNLSAIKNVSSLPTPNVEPIAAPDSLFALTLLRDEEAIDGMVADVDGATRILRPLGALILGGFAAHALAMSLFFATELSWFDSVHRASIWFVAATVGYFISIGAGLPSYWFYGVIARVPAPSWRLAVELLRVQAVGSVVLVALLPFWLAATLWLNMIGLWNAEIGSVWMALSYALPFIAALPGVVGLYRTFCRMRAATGISGRTSPALLTVLWIVLFQYTAPITMYAIYQALI